MRVRGWRGAGAAGAALALALASPAPAQRFGERADVVAIEVPVQVVRDGEPVRGLTAADFEVFEGRRQLAVTGFDVVDLAAVPASPAPGTAAPAGTPVLPPAVPIAARRHFLLLFDLTFAEPKSIVQARAAARQVVATALHPSDLVAVATYGASEGPKMVLGFTSDRRQTAAAIDSLGLPQLVERGPDPLRLTIQQLKDEGGPGAAELIELLEAMERSIGNVEPQKRAVAFSRSMTDLARLMGGIAGRKYVLYLSEGFDSSAIVGTSDQQEITQINRTSETDPWLVDSDKRFGNTRAANVLADLFEELRRADCVVQSIDIGGLRPDVSATTSSRGSEGRSRTGKDSLFVLARETGGEFYENFNDPKVAMGQMLRRTSVTYVLTVQPDDLKLDGAYHRLNVVLKGQPRGTRVVHRPGFYAPKPFAERSPLERLLDTAGTIVGGEEGGTVQAAVLAAPFRAASASPGSDTRAYVPVLIEVDGPSLLAGLTGDVLPAEIYAYAIEESGAVEDFFTQNMGLDLAKAGPVLKQRGLKFFGHLDLPPGRYSVRVLVRNARTGAHALRAVPLEVPSFTGGPVLLPPLFPEPAGRWLMTRETQQPDDRQVAFPFLQGGRPFIPASRPVLQAGQTARLALAVYNLGSGEVQAEAALLGAGGKEAGRAPLALVREAREEGAATAGGEGGPDRLAATWAVPALPAGDYVLQVSLSAGGVRRTSQLPVVIRGGVAGDG